MARSTRENGTTLACLKLPSLPSATQLLILPSTICLSEWAQVPEAIPLSLHLEQITPFQDSMLAVSLLEALTPSPAPRQAYSTTPVSRIPSPATPLASATEADTKTPVSALPLVCTTLQVSRMLLSARAPGSATLTEALTSTSASTLVGASPASLRVEATIQCRDGRRASTITGPTTSFTATGPALATLLEISISPLAPMLEALLTQSKTTTFTSATQVRMNPHRPFASASKTTRTGIRLTSRASIYKTLSRIL